METLARIAAKIAVSPPKVKIRGDHLYDPDLEESSIPEEWKKVFRDVLKTKKDVLWEIPGINNVTSFSHLKKLNFKKGKLVDSIENLMEKVKAEVPSANWGTYEDALRKLSNYELMLGYGLPSEASDWMYEMHSIISEMFRLIEGISKKVSVSSMAARIASAYLNGWSF